MPIQTKKFPGLTGNQLKLIALVSMTCDHVGVQLFPKVLLLRIIGRLALPIFAYMIAEGCRYTRDRKKYLLRMASLAAVCQVVYFFAMKSLYQCILITFSLSVILIWLIDLAEQEKTAGARIRLFGAVAVVFFLCVVLPDLLPHTDYEIDYGLPGVLLPVLIYGGGTKGLLFGSALTALKYGGVQWIAFLTVPLLLAYNGQRGKANIGKLFYWYYPLHLVAIYGIGLLI